MIVKSGTHAGKSTQLLLLRSPDYVVMMMTQHPDNALCAHFKSHIRVLDNKPFQTTCRLCGNPAVLATAYRMTTDLEFFCGSCDPYGAGAVQGRLTTIRTFQDAIDHVNDTCSAPRGDMRSIIRALSEAKGAPSRIGNSQAEDFLP